MKKFSIPRVVRIPVEVQATDALRESIVNASIPAGARITEGQLAAQMNLSRASVRTALHQLAQEGLTSLVPYTGWTVVSLTSRDVWELYTLRSSNEGLAAELVVKAMDESKAASITRAYDALVLACERGEAGKVAEADFKLHKTIVDLADHSRLATQYKFIERQIRMYIRSSDALVEDPSMIVEQHRPIVQAMLSGNAEEARKLSESHNLTEGEKLRVHLAAREAPGAPAGTSTKRRSPVVRRKS